MANPCSRHRHDDVTVTIEDMLDALLVATSEGTERVVAVACVDEEFRPGVMMVVDDCPADAAAVERIIDVLLDVVAEGAPIDAIAIAASRPGAPPSVTPADEDAWIRLLGTCEDNSVDVLDWWIIADGVVLSVPWGRVSPPIVSARSYVAAVRSGECKISGSAGGRILH